MQSHEDHQPKKTKPTKLDKDKWSQLIGEWQRSGESQKLFCERHGLNINTFVYMKGKLRPAHKINKLKTFIPVISTPESNKYSTEVITLESSNGLKLSIPMSLPSAQLSHLLNLLGWKYA